MVVSIDHWEKFIESQLLYAVKLDNKIMQYRDHKQDIKITIKISDLFLLD